jgi:hypothetical protein
MIRTEARTPLAAALGAALLVLGTGCASPGSSDERLQDRSTASASSITRDRYSASVETDHRSEEDPVRIRISIGDQAFGATLEDSPASRDLVALLPVTVEMTDHGGVEKTGALPGPLSVKGQPEGADPGVGDLGYYAPGNDLVLYYGDQSYFAGIVVLGRLDSDAAERIEDMEGSVTATVDAW